MPKASLGSGDDGYTSLLGPRRIPKYHGRPEAYGTVDEASAALGLARSLARSPDASRIVIDIQRDLYQVMAELSILGRPPERFVPLDASRVTWLEQELARVSQEVEHPSGFVLAGDSLAGAAFDLARTVVRRAERLVARLHHEHDMGNPELLRYLNRLSSLCFMLALLEDKLAGIDKPTLAHAESQ